MFLFTLFLAILASALVYGAGRLRGLVNLAFVIGLLTLIFGAYGFFLGVPLASDSVQLRMSDALDFSMLNGSFLPPLLVGAALVYFCGCAKDYYRNKEDRDASASLQVNTVIAYLVFGLSVVIALTTLDWS